MDRLPTLELPALRATTLAETAHTVERVAEVVHKACGHFREPDLARCFNQPLLRLLQGRLRFLALGDVLNESFVIAGFPVVVAHHPRVFRNPDDPPFAAAHLVFETPHIIRPLNQLFKPFAHRGIHVDLIFDVAHLRHQGGGGGVAVHPGERRVDLQKPAAGRAPVNALDRVFEQGAVIGLGLAELRFAFLAFRDVDERQGELAGRTIPARSGRDNQFAPDRFSVGAIAQEFTPERLPAADRAVDRLRRHGIGPGAVQKIQLLTHRLRLGVCGDGGERGGDLDNGKTKQRGVADKQPGPEAVEDGLPQLRQFKLTIHVQDSFSPPLP